MSDNEKRAHDLAVAICLDVCNMKRQHQISAGKTEITVDYFSEYMNAYDLAIEAFNEKFPDGK